MSTPGPVPRTRFLLLATAGATLLTAVPVLGDDHRPPEVILWLGARQQVGQTSTGLWSTPIDSPHPSFPPGQYCGAWTWDPAPYPYPPALRVRPGVVRARIEFQKAHAPENISIRGWTAVKGGERRGQRAFAYALRPLEEGGQVVAWVADFTFRVRKHLYVDVSAEWPDQEGMGCAGDRQYATWNFHVKNRRA